MCKALFLNLYYSKCGFQIENIIISWGLVKNAYGPHPRFTESESLGVQPRSLCFNMLSMLTQSPCTLKFDYHCGRQCDPSVNMANTYCGLGCKLADGEFMSHSNPPAT